MAKICKKKNCFEYLTPHKVDFYIKKNKDILSYVAQYSSFKGGAGDIERERETLLPQFVGILCCTPQFHATM